MRRVPDLGELVSFSGRDVVWQVVGHSPNHVILKTWPVEDKSRSHTVRKSDVGRLTRATVPQARPTVDAFESMKYMRDQAATLAGMLSMDGQPRDAVAACVDASKALARCAGRLDLIAQRETRKAAANG